MDESPRLIDGVLLLSWFWSSDVPAGEHALRLRALQERYDVIPNDARVEAARQWLWQVHVALDPVGVAREGAASTAAKVRSITRGLLERPEVLDAAEVDAEPEMVALALRAGLSWTDLTALLAQPDGLESAQALAALRSTSTGEMSLGRA